MIIDISINMMKKAFDKITYQYMTKPKATLDRDYGIYVHIPFCYTKCNFCPFYKELYDKAILADYVNELIKEINSSNISGAPLWVYIGGGTPNTLEISQLIAITDALKHKVIINNMGIELLPSKVTKSYLDELKRIGFTKISLGVESMHEGVICSSGRINSLSMSISEIIKYALDLGLFVNCDLMVGIIGQSGESFLNDISSLSALKPSQITTYPYMCISNEIKPSSMTEEEQFNLIEKACKALNINGYIRESVWTFAMSNDVYDSSRDELVNDYIGFGAGAFSTYDNYKVVNPKLNLYMSKNNIALVAQKDKCSDNFRLFGRMIYDTKLCIERSSSFPVRMMTMLLIMLGYGSRGKLTSKGINYAHSLTKTIVENLPYPLQNPNKIINREEYEL